jgi:translation initiation factor IF-2
MRMEPVPVPTDTQRRHAAKPGGRTVRREEEEGRLRLPSRRHAPEGPPPVDREITISEGITVKELSEKLGVKANMVIKKLVERKIFATINQSLDVKLAEEMARAFGASTNKVSYEEESTQGLEQAEEPKDMAKRPPVVTVMGHVDHGKTSLLDAIRSSHVADREAGGITQHIGASHIEHNGQTIVFIDTPGHEAFTRMRARGAKVTDIVVLVVAADDGVMPQTLEAIDHARAAEVPIIVAINKIDKPGAQPERIKQQLADRNLLAEDWGGNVVMVPVSAKAKTNLELLLEMILLVAEMEALTASPGRPAIGTVLEQKLDRGRGPVATVLVQNGTLNVGDYFICGSVFSKVRAMFDDRGNPIKEAGPSMPVEVLGLESLPDVGDTFQVVTDTAKAKQIVMYRESKTRELAMAKGARLSLDQLHEQMREGETKELPIILKTDVGGTAEVLTDTLQKLTNDKIKVRVLHSGVGAINETDVLLASASNAIIVGFNVRPERTAANLAEHEKVDIRLHTIIYELTDEIKRAMTGMLEPVFKEQYKGRAEVREVFNISKVGTIAGCMVIDGVITRDSQIRLLRDSVVVHTGKLESLKRFKNDASEVKSGFECGLALANFNDIKPSDIIEAFAMEKMKAELPA